MTVLINVLDGLSTEWVEGIGSILFAFQQHGARGKKEAACAWRWRSLSGAGDLVAMGTVGCQVAPTMFALFNPVTTSWSSTGATVV